MLFRLIIAVLDRKASLGILFYLLQHKSVCLVRFLMYILMGLCAKLWFKAQMRFKVICILL